jgi:nucleoside-diphosphate-sugar epimerase
MIVGNGLIANSVKNKVNDEELIIFASGVSNSKEMEDKEYNKELSLLEQVILENPNKKLIYFSSCSVESTINVRYNQHKLNVESFIKNVTDNYIILRLPNVVGRPSKNNQLINYFYYSLINESEITINANYIRHLVDVDDLPTIINKLKNENRVTLNVAFNNGITVSELVSVIEEIVGIKFKKISTVSGVNDYVIDNNHFLKLVVNDKDYNTEPKHIIKKYYTKNEN